MRNRTTIQLISDRLEYVDTDEEQYITQVGVAGELILYRVTTAHKLLASTTKDQLIMNVWATGIWEEIIHDTVEDEE